MKTSDAKPRPSVGLSNKDALHELLVASLALSMQIDEAQTAEHILDALRTLHACDEVEEADAGFQ